MVVPMYSTAVRTAYALEELIDDDIVLDESVLDAIVLPDPDSLHSHLNVLEVCICAALRHPLSEGEEIFLQQIPRGQHNKVRHVGHGGVKRMLHRDTLIPSRR
jgi:hypothetical protein